MPCDVCAEAGEVKSAIKTANPEILRISVDGLFRLEVMVPSLLAPKYDGPDAVRSWAQRNLLAE
jgi:hypothetical protein